ncbi:helix-turn-helix domain-containing protein [Streptomyces sp. NPDC001046]|uniref:helix-turn-helix domain-containing protein n=1 Tax=Streptomyces sp. NPDC001046 TaxID=3364543 RepID=UPI00367BE351
MGTDEVLVQGDRETDPKHLVQPRDVEPFETFVRVRRSLLSGTRPVAPHPPFSRSPRSRTCFATSGTPRSAWRPAAVMPPGARLRELRTEACLEGKDIARMAGWQTSKASRVRNGKQTPARADLTA